MTRSSRLHLPNLTIEGFRGIDSLTIPRFGRVTLLTGKNSVGKTTVLEAVRMFAARGRPGVLDEILTTHQEAATAIDEDGDEVSGPDLLALFHRRGSSTARETVVGPLSVWNKLRLHVEPLTEQQLEEVWISLPEPVANDFMDDSPQALKAEFHNRSAIVGIATGLANGAASRVLSWHPRTRGRPPLRSRFSDVDLLPSPIVCEHIGPGLPNDASVVRYMDKVALTEAQDRAIDALRLIFGSEVEDVAIVGRGRPSHYAGPRPIVKFGGYDGPVPLRSLGDGALRMFGVALALANSRDGILLIDEAENGIHYSLQREFWRMVLQAADRNNVQVIATTHGWDCIVGFARASIELGHIGSRLVRLSRARDKLRAVEYTEQEMITAAEQGIEMR